MTIKTGLDHLTNRNRFLIAKTHHLTLLTDWPWSGAAKVAPPSAVVAPGALPGSAIPAIPGTADALGASSSMTVPRGWALDCRSLMIWVRPPATSTELMMRAWSHCDMRRFTSTIISPAFDTANWISSRVGWITWTQKRSDISTLRRRVNRQCCHLVVATNTTRLE